MNLSQTFSLVSNATQEKVHRTSQSRCSRQQKENKKTVLNKRKISTTDLKQKYTCFPASFFIVTVGIIVWQTCYFLNLGFSNSTKRVNRNEKFTAVEDVEKTIASLSRITNAIALLNEVDKSPKILKKIIGESLYVQDAHLFDFINQSSVLDVTDVIKSLNFITVQKNNDMLNKIKMDLKNIVYNETTPITQLGSTLFSFDISKVDIKWFKYVKNIINRLETVNKMLNSSSLDPELHMTLHYGYIHTNMMLRDLDNSNNIKNFYDFVNVLKNINSFIVNIEKYRKLTSQTYVSRLVSDVRRLLPSVTIIERLLEPNVKNRVIERLYSIERLMRTDTTVSDKQALIGFPRGSKDMEMLLTDLDDDQLKNFLNEGRSLSKLKRLLLPVSELSFPISIAENVWTKPDKMKYLNLIRQSLKLFQGMELLNITAVSNFLNNVNTTLERQEPIDKLNNSILDEFTKHLTSSQTFLNYSIEAEELIETRKKIQLLNDYLGNISLTLRDIDNSTHMEILRNADLGKCMPLLLSLRNKGSYFEKQTAEIIDLFSKIAGFKDTFSYEVLIKIYEIVETQRLFELDVKEVIGYIEFINFLSRLTEEKFSAIEELPELFMSAKNQIGKWRTLEKTLKSEIRKTTEYNDLKRFPYSRELTTQLVYFQRTLSFFKRHDLKQTFQSFLQNGMVLVEKIKCLPFFEKHLAGSAWDNFALFNQSMCTLLSEIHAIPSKIPIREPNLRSLADAMSTFDSVNIPPLNFDLMIKSLNLLESIYDERSLEVASFKKSIGNMRDLQFADLRKKHSLSKLLTLADLFFKSFFLGQKKSETNGQVPSLVFIFTGIIISVFALFVFWVWSIKAKKSGTF